MRFKLDENIPVDLATLLREAGHDVQTVYDENMSGAPDDALAETCRRERRALMSFDLDFSDVRIYRPKDHFGLLVFRLAHQDPKRLLSVCRNLLPIFDNESIEGHLWIVEEDRVRMRP